MAADLVIAMVTHNSASALEKTLAINTAVARELRAPFVVADNASCDSTLDMLRRATGEYPGLETVRLQRNLGYAAGVNAAAAAAPGADLLLINPDVTLPGAEALVSLCRQLERWPRAAVVAPALIGPEGGRQPSARAFPWLGALVASLGVPKWLPRVSDSYERFVAPSNSDDPIAVDWVIGAAAVLRRATFDELGGWDERFFLYMEDADYCRRCWRAGWEVWYVPSLSFRHDYQRVSSTEGATVISSWSRRRHIVSLARFFAREPALLLRWSGRRVRQP
ncbi:MAG: glycosyltransferase family 2 protein [Actinomycetota bacterium]|nr:glycosyltransferase family 2 protein [Actinomycetota bacterium]